MVCPEGIPVFHSRRDYLNMLYGVVDDEGDIGYASAYDGRFAGDHSLMSPFSYSVSPGPTVSGPTPASPWWSDGDNWERVPARETSNFRVGWLHPDAPEGGLTVDYAYLLRQQHYMNAELLANLRSYTTDGERVTRGIRSTPHAWVFNGLTTITCSTGSTCTLSVDMNQVAVRQINVVYLEVNFNPAYNRVASGTENRNLTQQGHSPPEPFSGQVPTHTPTSSSGPNPDLLGQKTYYPEYYYYDIRDVRHPSFVEDAAASSARIEAGQLAGTRAVAYNEREVYPTPDDLIFDHGHASDTEFVGYIKDYPDTKYDSLVVQMRLPTMYRQDVMVDYSVSEPSGSGPYSVSLFGSEHGKPIMRSRVPVRVPDPRPTSWPNPAFHEVAGLEAVAAYEQVSISAAPRSGFFFTEWETAWPKHGPSGTCNSPSGQVFPVDYPFEMELYDVSDGYASVLDVPYVASDHPQDDYCSEAAVGGTSGTGGYVGPKYVEDAFWFRWPVLYSDVAWYLFELDEFNKAVADSPEAIEAVVGHSGMRPDLVGVQPAYQLDPSMMGYGAEGTPQAYDPGPKVPHRWLLGRDVWGNVEDHLYALLDNHRNTVAVVGVDSLATRAGDGTRVPLIEPDVPSGPGAGLDWDAEHVRVTETPVWSGSRLVFGGRQMGYADAAADWRAVYFPDMVSGGDTYRYGVFRTGIVDLGPGATPPLGQGSQPAYHGLTFVPMRTPTWNGAIATRRPNAVFYDPGGVLVKRGVAGMKDPGLNSLAEWNITDGQSLTVGGAAPDGPDHRMRLGLADPGSHYAYRQAIQWPDLGINPNRSHLLVTLYFEAKLADPFYLVRETSQRAEGSVSYTAVGAVPRIQMRPVMCRTFVQPLGVNQGVFKRYVADPFNKAWDVAGDGVTAIRKFGSDLMKGEVSLNPLHYAGKAVKKLGNKVADAIKIWFEDYVKTSIGGFSEMAATEAQGGACTVMSEADVQVSGSGAASIRRASREKRELLRRCAEERAKKQQAINTCINTGEGNDGTCPTLPDLALRVSLVEHQGAVTGTIIQQGPSRMSGHYLRPHLYNYEDGAARLPKIQRHQYVENRPTPPPARFRFAWDIEATSPTAAPGESQGTICPVHTPQTVSGTYTPAMQAADLQSILSSTYDPGDLPLGWVQGLHQSGLCRPLFVKLRCDLTTSDVTEYGRAPGGECLQDLTAPAVEQPPLTAVLSWEPKGPPPVGERASRETYYEIEFKFPKEVGGFVFDDRPLRGTSFDRTSEQNLFGVPATRAGWAHVRSHMVSPPDEVGTPAPTPVESRSVGSMDNYMVLSDTVSSETFRVPALWRRWNGSATTGDWEYRYADQLPFGHLGALTTDSFFSGSPGPTWSYGTCVLAARNSSPGNIPTAVVPAMNTSVSPPIDRCDYLVDDAIFGLNQTQFPNTPPHEWWRPVVDGSGDVHKAFRNMYFVMMYELPLYGDLAYDVRIRAVHDDDGSSVVYGKWSDYLTVGPSAMCTLLDPEAQEAEWRDLGCSRHRSDTQTTTQASATVSPNSLMGYTWFWTVVGSDLCTSWFDSTPGKFTWGHPVVVRGWSVVWVLAITALALMIFWQGIRMTYDMWLHGGWTNQRDPGFREMVPRFIIAIILSAASLWICRLVIVLASNVSCYVSKTLDVSLWQLVLGFFLALIPFIAKAAAAAFAATHPALIIAILLVLLGAVLGILTGFAIIFGKLLFQLILRLALLSVLVVLSPLAFMMLASPDTEGQFKKWLDMFVVTMVTQSIQLIVLFVGFKMFGMAMKPFDGVSGGGLVGFIMVIAILYLATQVPALLDRYLGRDFSGGGSVVESSSSAAASSLDPRNFRR